MSGTTTPSSISRTHSPTHSPHIGELDTTDLPPPPADAPPANSENVANFRSFMKTLASFTGDLSSMTCPSFLLSPISVLEYSGYWCDYPNLLAAITQFNDPEDRMIACVKWFISSLAGSYTSRVQKHKGEWEKKPYNPVLGEQYFAKWADVDGSGETEMICEQVSHHPPVSAFYIENKKHGIYVNDHNGQKSGVKGVSVHVDQVGHGTIHLMQRDGEMYYFTLPSLVVNGLWYAAPYLELTGTTYIVSTSGFTSIIEFSGKSWLGGGERHHFKATIQRTGPSPNGSVKSGRSTPSAEKSHHHGPGKLVKNLSSVSINSDKSHKDSHVIIEGQWSGASTIIRSGHSKSSAVPFYDTSVHQPEPRIIKPLEEQGELESHRVWKATSYAIIAGDYQLASAEKSKLENGKRAERKAREGRGEKWTPALFEDVEDDEELRALQEVVTVTLKGKIRDTVGRGWVAKRFIEMRN
ncbi:hypothetical protein BZG36_02620 [Bifiguratus adelaidae]|uniref:Oxysterol-binding protein n=1 Tax=Bifiguratus adelaidae TaxID=1938954 RepID=A0A261Y2R8_9FUNG|nr:hypothetical protein BZG36_02620 [Bifiguratus adelaidae]